MVSTAQVETYGNGKDGGHSEEIVWVLAHGQDLGDDGRPRPIHTKDVSQALEVDGSGLADAKDGVAQPRHTERAELIVKELHAELSGEQGNVLDDGLSDPPLLVLGEFHNGGEKRLRQTIDTDDYISSVIYFTHHC
jgi:hypothetical protein